MDLANHPAQCKALHAVHPETAIRMAQADDRTTFLSDEEEA